MLLESDYFDEQDLNDVESAIASIYTELDVVGPTHRVKPLIGNQSWVWRPSEERWRLQQGESYSDNPEIGLLVMYGDLTVSVFNGDDWVHHITLEIEEE